ncbi:MAG TPA: hypothetical protein VM051_10475 [Usitatibacter sp.]|nr:hypothetical protein [Usitatibacter sp.]
MRPARTWVLAAVIVASGLVSGGCAVGRSEVKLGSPGMEAPAAAGGKVVVIRSVKDERVFEQSPRDPSTPSLGGEGAASASAETKARAIARKRNTYGMALGDVVLEQGKTVEVVVRENLSAALRKAGYDVRDAAGAGAAPIFIDARIRKFWAWFTPGAFMITLRANIETDLTVSGGNPPVNVSVSSEQSGMFGGDGMWIEVVDKALQQYRDQAASKTAGLK